MTQIQILKLGVEVLKHTLKVVWLAYTEKNWIAWKKIPGKTNN